MSAMNRRRLGSLIALHAVFWTGFVRTVSVHQRLVVHRWFPVAHAVAFLSLPLVLRYLGRLPFASSLGWLSVPAAAGEIPAVSRSRDIVLGVAQGARDTLLFYSFRRLSPGTAFLVALLLPPIARSCPSDAAAFSRWLAYVPYVLTFLAVQPFHEPEGVLANLFGLALGLASFLLDRLVVGRAASSQQQPPYAPLSSPSPSPSLFFLVSPARAMAQVACVFLISGTLGGQLFGPASLSDLHLRSIVRIGLLASLSSMGAFLLEAGPTSHSRARFVRLASACVALAIACVWGTLEGRRRSLSLLAIIALGALAWSERLNTEPADGAGEELELGSLDGPDKVHPESLPSSDKPHLVALLPLVLFLLPHALVALSSHHAVRSSLWGTAVVVPPDIDIIFAYYNEPILGLSDMVLAARNEFLGSGYDLQVRVGHKGLADPQSVEELQEWVAEVNEGGRLRVVDDAWGMINIGREGATYLRWIIDSYDRLADFTIFLQGHMGFPEFNYWEDRLKLLRKGVGFMSFGHYLTTTNKTDDWGNGHFEQMGRIHDLFYPNEAYPTTRILTTYHGQFGVSRERIRAHPREMYVRLLEILEAPDDDPIHHEPGSFDYKGVHQGVANPFFGHSLERAWTEIFQCTDPEPVDCWQGKTWDHCYCEDLNK